DTRSNSFNLGKSMFIPILPSIPPTLLAKPFIVLINLFDLEHMSIYMIYRRTRRTCRQRMENTDEL
ncbi:MAG: hypothetical protein ACPGDA_07755, partial [Paracoccaceae bacterium]